MVAMNKRFEIEDEIVVDEYDDLKQWSDSFDSAQYIRDMAFWSGLSLCIGIFIGMAIMAVSK